MDYLLTLFFFFRSSFRSSRLRVVPSFALCFCGDRAAFAVCLPLGSALLAGVFSSAGVSPLIA
jgi:hypothetical protein